MQKLSSSTSSLPRPHWTLPTNCPISPLSILALASGRAPLFGLVVPVIPEVLVVPGVVPVEVVLAVDWVDLGVEVVVVGVAAGLLLSLLLHAWQLLLVCCCCYDLAALVLLALAAVPATPLTVAIACLALTACYVVLET